MAKSKLLWSSSDNNWTFDRLRIAEEAIMEICHKELRLNLYPNQIEIIGSDQMLDAYSSVGLPIMYNHWSFGKHFIQQERSYRSGQSGLAYEIVINSNPCISYLMEENSMTMQALVIAHAAGGHNHVFKNNYLFKQWTDAGSIVDYLIFAKKYISQMEEQHGPAEVEKLLDACHAIMDYGVDRYKRPTKLNKAQEAERQKIRAETVQAEANLLWPKKKSAMTYSTGRFPKEPQENLLYFMEKHSPSLKPWEREIVRIVRKVSQYFYPQRQTKCVDADTEFLTVDGWKKISEFKTGDFIAAYDIETRSVRFEQPSKYHVNNCETMIRFVNTRNDQVVTDDHNMVYVNRNTKKISSAPASQLIDKNKNDVLTLNTATYAGKGVGLPENLLRLHVAFKADGYDTSTKSKYHNKSSKGVHAFGFKKERKIDRLKKLLEKEELFYKEVKYPSSPDVTIFHTHIPNATKHFDWKYSDLSLDDAKVIFDEIFYWDGTRPTLSFRTINKNDADFIQFVGSMLGYRASVFKYQNVGSFNPDGHTYQVKFTTQNTSRLGEPEEFVPSDRKSYCFTTSTGAWLSRRSGKISATGNCLNEGWASFVHYYVMNRLWEKKLIDDGSYLEFIHSHSSVLTQRPHDSKHYSGFNPYALGFDIFTDIVRICKNPTEEDKQYFPDLIGRDWLEVCLHAVENYRDESFISQFLSPTVMRKWGLFEITNKEADSFVTVSAIHNATHYNAIRQTLSKQYSIASWQPDIQIVNANLSSSRLLQLKYKPIEGSRLNDNTEAVLDHIERLWGYDVMFTPA